MELMSKISVIVPVKEVFQKTAVGTRNHKLATVKHDVISGILKQSCMC